MNFSEFSSTKKFVFVCVVFKKKKKKKEKKKRRKKEENGTGYGALGGGKAPSFEGGGYW